MTQVRFSFRDVTQGTWDDFARLFDGKGGPKACWCMAWRPADQSVRRGPGEGRRQAMKSRVDDKVPVGILAYADNEPVGWCSVAPRETYRPLGGPDVTEPVERVWSVVCFFVKREWRDHGLMGALLEEAIGHARHHGATVLEAYPVDPDSPSYRFMGFVDRFAQAGFVKVGKAGQRRHVMRLALVD